MDKDYTKRFNTAEELALYTAADSNASWSVRQILGDRKIWVLFICHNRVYFFQKDDKIRTVLLGRDGRIRSEKSLIPPFDISFFWENVDNWFHPKIEKESSGYGSWYKKK